LQQASNCDGVNGGTDEFGFSRMKYGTLGVHIEKKKG
jgi:hypothetical protein